ncbi:alpha/beta fold hydrolase [Methylobacterium sp. J-077]|uniref:alpha/beta fold hydrolase n=1 Tax=Methylobacterium sp. J-077 TaxID=2836656 RepID=UPI001FB91798|nr:alpha/beta hydrolase [Methylobacterium sp. J-077]MCJ2124922.1 alpha/beta hydrolase [Methylobacterium sp. J-077]
MSEQQVKTTLLDVNVDVAGPAGGPAVLLLHGWPDDATAWTTVAGHLNEAGFRTVTPALRGFGGTRFRSADMPRTGNSGILAHDAIDLMDAMGIETFMVAGHDWGSNAAEAMAVGWPGRVSRMAMLSTPSRLGGMPTPPFPQCQRQWYHWFQATRRGQDAVRADPKGFGRIMWENWSPPGWYDDATFAAVAASWENPDFVDVTLHSYQARWDEAEPDPRSAELEAKVKATKTLSTPTLYIQGAVDGVNPPEASKAVPSKFDGPFEFITLDGVGHFAPREAPDAVAAALVRHFRSTEGNEGAR